jgi:hypothetical protein
MFLALFADILPLGRVCILHALWLTSKNILDAQDLVEKLKLLFGTLLICVLHGDIVKLKVEKEMSMELV